MVGTFSNILQPSVVCSCLRRKVWKADCKFGVKLGRMCGLLALPMDQQVKNLPAVQETQEMQSLSLSWENPLEEEMATCSSIVAWRIPRTEDPERLQSKGLPRVGHNWVTKHTHTHAHTHAHMWQWHGATSDVSIFKSTFKSLLQQTSQYNKNEANSQLSRKN